jgi:hypothetical protein
MKNIALIFALGLSTNLTFAATNQAFYLSDNRAMEQARLLSEKLQLNESVFIQVKQLEDHKYKEIDKVVTQQGNEAQKETLRQEIENTYNNQILALLNASQKVAFLNLLQQTTAVTGK